MKSFVVIFAFSLFFISFAVRAEKAVEDVLVHTASGETKTLQLEIAQTPIEHEIGLMLRRDLPDNGGMLFYFGRPASEKAFWMKNTLIPLDMIFIGDDNKIVKIHPMAEPESTTPVPSDFPVVAVIEVKGGRAEALGIKVGDRVEADILK